MGDKKENKHIDVRYHVGREACDNEKAVLNYSPSTEMIADTLSKQLRLNTFKYIK